MKFGFVRTYFIMQKLSSASAVSAKVFSKFFPAAGTVSDDGRVF